MTFPSLYLIADPVCYADSSALRSVVERRFLNGVHEAIEGGVQWIQYREKHATRGQMYAVANKLSQITRDTGVQLIINDDIDLALSVRADGVHLGQDDFPVFMARKLLGKEAVIGLSTHDMCQARQAEAEAVDYIGFGPVFQTRTKQNADPVVGIGGVAVVSKAVSLPVYAIGGIQYTHLAEIIYAGAAGVSVASGLAGAKQEDFMAWQNRLAEAVSQRTLKI